MGFIACFFFVRTIYGSIKGAKGPARRATHTAPVLAPEAFGGGEGGLFARPASQSARAASEWVGEVRVCFQYSEDSH